jgi:hypothetical protein
VTAGGLCQNDAREVLLEVVEVESKQVVDLMPPQERWQFRPLSGWDRSLNSEPGPDDGLNSRGFDRKIQKALVQYPAGPPSYRIRRRRG